ncbi:MAG: DUF885 domain-containing protein [Flavobacteriales bacterium]|jgi:uncharacterized protein (DUF885 family)|tara:strand:+ start:3910 stop:5673 length:1764 start_codon:yes stop_codon:yes gene_type:complete
MNKSIIIISLFAFLFFSCNSKEKSGEEINKIFESYYQESLKLYPLRATTQGDERYNDFLPNNLSDDFRNKEKIFYREYINYLNEFDDNVLGVEDLLSKKVLLWECDRNLERLSFNEHLTPINQMWTLQLDMGQNAGGLSAQPFKTINDYNNWLKRIDDYIIWLNSAEERMREGVKNDHVLPKSLIKKVIPQLETILNTDLETNLFYSPTRQFPSLFSVDEKTILSDKYANMVLNKIIPTYQNLYNFMKNEYLNNGRDSSGINALEHGISYYDYSIKLYTTTSMSADEIHNLGLSEVARISSEMELIKNKVGFKGDLKSFFNHVRELDELIPFNNPDQVINNFNKIHKKMLPQLNSLFGLQPKTPFEVRRTESFREASASAEYNSGSLDGTRPGIFYVPIPNIDEYNFFSDEDLFLHEAIPGHHFQISLQQENESLPSFRKSLWYSAYGEGWALYSESLGKELGLYDEPYQYFGMLSAEMHRSIRLVVDTGIHTKGWSREKAIQYSLDNEAESESGIISEIERYMANPGQALSYKIGQLKIRQLRSKAKISLGNKFDIKMFHEKILESGCIPLKLLEEKIDEWIEKVI